MRKSPRIPNSPLDGVIVPLVPGDTGVGTVRESRIVMLVVSVTR